MQPQQIAGAGANRLDALPHLVESRRDVAQQRFARDVEVYSAALPLEQRGTHQDFKLADRVADRAR